MTPPVRLARANAAPAFVEAQSLARFAEPASATILVAEDDPDLQALLADLLVSEGYTAMQTWNGADVHRLARQYQPDAIILDLILPRLSGLEVIAQLRQDSATRAIPIVVVSASARLMLEHESRRADAVIQKPFELTALLETLERVLVRPVAHGRQSTYTASPSPRPLLAAP